MPEVDEFIENFLQHRTEYDPVAAREYYLRTRKLKGRQPGKAQPAKKGDPRAYKDGYGKPLPKLGKRFEEDQSPLATPGGETKLLSYDQGPHNLGRATYADGYTYDAKTGWSKAAPKATPPRKQRISNAEAKLTKIKNATNKIKDPKVKADTLRKLQAVETKLKKVKSSPSHAPDRRPVL